MPLLRSLLFLCAVTCTLPAAIPEELASALKRFRSDPPPGWSYTQTTTAEGKSTVERHDAAKPAFNRWSLIRKDNREPTLAELREYDERRSRWSRTGTAPNITEQLDFESIEMREQTSERAVFQARLRRGESSDRTAPYLRVTIVLHKPSNSIESLELASVAAFSPALGVRIASLTTTMTYQLPDGDVPALPLSIQTRVRGRAYLVKSLDADMEVTYSDYARARQGDAGPRVQPAGQAPD